MKGHCIICHKNNLELTDEHVIPDSLGGSYHIFSVCKNCNSYMGRFADISLINHPLIKLYREKYKLSGKTGKIPSFLCDKPVFSSDDNDKMQFYKDDNDNLKLKYLPETKYMKKQDGNIEFEIVCDEQDKDMIIDNIRNKYKAKGANVIFNEPVASIEKGKRIYRTFEINDDIMFGYVFGFLKIAYESSCDVFSSYEDDENAIAISKMLISLKLNKNSTGDYEELFHKYGIIDLQNAKDHFQKRILPAMDCLHIRTSNQHIIWFKYVEQFGLYCFISLFEEIRLGIKISKRNYLEKYTFICITTDYKNKKCKRMRFSSISGLEFF